MKLTCLIFISFVVGVSMSAVGGEVGESGETYSWTLPVILFLLMFVPAVTAYLAGREDEKTVNQEKNKQT